MIKKSKIAIGTAVAAAAGYVTGVLTAPKSGKQTRKDISKKASKTKTEGEKQLKSLYSDLTDQVSKGEKKINSSKSKVDKKFKDSVDTAKKTQDKAKQLLSALHDGDADDPDLKKIIGEVKKAKANLGKFIKK